jgi:hypothetical protein
MILSLECLDNKCHNLDFKIKEKKILSHDIVYVRDMKTNDPYGLYIDPRRGNKEYKKYTHHMIINTQLTTVLNSTERYYFI